MGSAPESGDMPVPEKQDDQEGNSILPSYLDIASHEALSRWFVPNKELLKEKGWDSFAEFALDISGSLPKPDNPSIPRNDIAALDEKMMLSVGVPANEWEELTVNNLEGKGFAHLIPQFK